MWQFKQTALLYCGQGFYFDIKVLFRNVKLTFNLKTNYSSLSSLWFMITSYNWHKNAL